MPDQQRLEMIAEVARLYYQEGLSQTEIGEIFDISHSTISRMINEAHDEKIVEVIIRYPFRTVPSLSQDLKSQFKLQQAIVLSASCDSYSELIGTLGRQAARVVEHQLQDGLTLGISLGMAVASTVRHVHIAKPMHVKVVRLQGASDDELIEGTDLAQTLASQLGNDATIIPSPWLMKNAQATKLIMQEPSIMEALKAAEKADLALVGIGSTNPSVSTILRNELITVDELKNLQSSGAVGEICGKYFDLNGNILDVEFNQRTISIDIKKLAGFKTVIGVAGCADKAKAILGAIRGHLINILVTDSDTAQALLELDKLH